MKLLTISEDAGAKIACGRGMGNYYIISDGLSKLNRMMKPIGKPIDRLEKIS
jgi:hypothetical protein